MPSRLRITINGRVSPEERAKIYEDQLETALRKRFPGVSVIGGGTLTNADGEPLSCAVDLYGPSVPRMRHLIAGVLPGFPLAQRCRVVHL